MGRLKRTIYERDDYVGIFKPSRAIGDLHECQIIRISEDKTNIDTILTLTNRSPLILGIEVVYKINLLIDENNRQSN